MPQLGLGVLLEVALVVVLGAIERSRGNDLGDDRLPVFGALLQALLRGYRRRLLRGRVVENRGAVLGPHVPPLPVQRGRIVFTPEHVEQPIVRDARRVKLDLDRLRVSGLVAADLLISRVRQCPPGVTRDHLEHAVDLPKRRLDVPEAAGGECRLLGLRGPRERGSREREQAEQQSAHRSELHGSHRSFSRWPDCGSNARAMPLMQ